MSRSCRRTFAAALGAALLSLGAVPPHGLAAPGSLYSGPGPRPGPDILYAPAATAPQLTNAGIWKASPILVSGASAYRGGEYLYQDFLYDDHGAREQPDPADPRATGDTFSKPNGTYTYPTDRAYASNAADFVELRVRPLADSTAFRVTLNTLKDPSLEAFSLALGGTAGTVHPFPYGANASAPADLFLTVHGTTGDLTSAATGVHVASAPVTVDTTRRQIEVRVPHSAWDPTGQTVRLAAGAGLWDQANNRYLLPQPTADASHPGGSGAATSPPAFFHVAFRNNEPMPVIGDPPGTAQSPAWWRDKDQGSALASGDVSAFHADVDFRKLAAKTNDESAVPQSGPMDRILASHFETAQGADFSVNCFSGDRSTCPGPYQGRLQPYAIYVPRKPLPNQGYGMTLQLHSLSAPYNQYLGSRNQSQFGERGSGSIVITPEGRGPDGFYDSYAGADTFEVWADVARHYRLDPAWTVITGYSMGGYGTFKLGEQFPDLIAKGQPTVGASSDNNLVASLRNIPFQMWNSAVDELVPPASYLPSALKLDSLGYRYELDVFAPSEHLTLAINDQFAPAATFLGTTKVNRNPAHVTFVVAPKLNYPKLGFVADHAYWLSRLRLRNAGANGGEGTIDVRSRGFGRGDPPASPTHFGAGTLTGGTVPLLAYTRQWKTWGRVPSTPVEDQLDITATNVATVTVNARRARVSCDPKLNIKSDGPLQVHIVGCASRNQRATNRKPATRKHRRTPLRRPSFTG